MRVILKNSFFIKLLLLLCRKASFCYKNSTLCYTIHALKAAFRSSKTKRAFRKYLTRNAYFKFSATYRIIHGISNVLSLFARFLHYVFARLLRGSNQMRRIKRLKRTKGSLLMVYVGFFTAVLTLSYLLATLFTAPIENINVPATAALVILAIFCLLAGKVVDYAKNSAVYKIIIYFLED